jgi:hypothetical protein
MDQSRMRWNNEALLASEGIGWVFGREQRWLSICRSGFTVKPEVL